MATVEELEAKNAELMKALEDSKATGTDDEQRKRLEFLEGEHKTLISARDKAKEEKRLADEKHLTDQGEYKTLAEQRQADIDKLTCSSTKLAEQLAGYTKRDEERLAKLITTVPDNYKGLITDDLPLSKRLEMAETFQTIKPQPPGTRLPGEGGDPNKQTSVQRIAAGLKAGAL